MDTMNFLLRDWAELTITATASVTALMAALPRRQDPIAISLRAHDGNAARRQNLRPDPAHHRGVLARLNKL